MENLTKQKTSRISQLIEFTRDYRISILTSQRLSGVGDTLIGWAIIAINTVFFSPPVELISSEINFVFFYLSGCLALFFHTVYKRLFQGNLIDGIKDLLVKNDSEVRTDAIHLSVSQRIKWIYFRGFIAAGSYISYNISKIYFGVIDNSEIFGADALVYVLLAYIVLHDKLNVKEISGVFIASLGVFFVIFFDIEDVNMKTGLIAGTAGIISAITMSIIFFITGIIVRHDNPKRVAFHQCIAGLILATAILALTIIYRVVNHDFHFPEISTNLIKNSLVSGVLYAIALFFFLRAFLRAEPVVIAVVGYSLGIFIILLEWLFHGDLIGVNDGISAFLIGLGCFLLIREEYLKDNKKSGEIKTQKPIYETELNEELASLKEKLRSGDLDNNTYLAEKHEFNKLLLAYESEIKDSPIESIKIFQDALVFAFRAPLHIELETDGGARSAPFEILNFGSSGLEDELIAYDLLKDGDTILDIGAHIGWFTINSAKRFPNSQIYAFEPMDFIFDFLAKNIKRNDVKNVSTYNYGCYSKEEESFLYYFKDGSALSSIENVINHKNARKVKCILKPLDKIVLDLKIQSIDFIKCDTEGAEFFVFEGALETIKKYNPIIFVAIYEEWYQEQGHSSQDILKLLGACDYVPYRVVKRKLKEVKVLEFNGRENFDCLFLNKTTHNKLIETYVV